MQIHIPNGIEYRVIWTCYSMNLRSKDKTIVRLQSVQNDLTWMDDFVPNEGWCLAGAREVLIMRHQSLNHSQR